MGDLPTRKEVQELWKMLLDPDAYPDENEDSLHKEYGYMSEDVFLAYAGGRLVNIEDEVRNIVKRIAMTGAFSYGGVSIEDSKTWADDNPWFITEDEVDAWLDDPERNANRDWAFRTVRNILGVT